MQIQLMCYKAFIFFVTKYYVGGRLRLMISCTIRELEHLNFGS